MIERLSGRKKKGATLEDLRAAGAARPAKESVPEAEPPHESATDTLYAVSPKEYAEWEHEAAWRQRELSTTEFASVGEALRDFVALLGVKPLTEAAAEASATLTDNERHSFYDSLAAEEIMSVTDVLAMRKKARPGDAVPVPTPSYKERGAAVSDAKGISLGRIDGDRERKRTPPFKKMSAKEFERGMERHLAHVPDDADIAAEFKLSNTPSATEAPTTTPTFDETLANMKKELGEPFGIAYGSVVWKQASGTAELLDRDGSRWTMKPGEMHAFGLHGRVLMRYWTEQGFFDKETAAKWLAEKKRLDPKEETVSTASHAPVGDFRALVDEKLKSDAPYTMSAVGRIRPEKQKKETKKESKPANLGPEEQRLGRTVKEVTQKLGAPSEIDGISYWKRSDGVAVIFDAQSRGGPKMPLTVRENGTHRFPSGTKRWNGSEFVDVD